MDYEILEVQLKYKGKKLKEVAVVWQDGSCVRGSIITDQPCAGYGFITSDELSTELLQYTAGYGQALPADKRKKYFPECRNWAN